MGKITNIQIIKLVVVISDDEELLRLGYWRKLNFFFEFFVVLDGFLPVLL